MRLIVMGEADKKLLRKLFTLFPMSSLPKQFILFDSKRRYYSGTLFNSIKGSVFLDKFVKQLVAGALMVVKHESEIRVPNSIITINNK